MHKADHLYLRGNVYYFRAKIRKRIFSRAIGSVSKEEARKLAREWYAQAQLDRLDEVLDRTRNRDVYATIDEVCDRYVATCARLGRPTARTARNNTLALRLVLRRVLGREEVGTESTARLTADVVGDYVRAAIDGRAGEAEASARRTACSTLRQARSVFSRRMLREPEFRKLRLPALADFLEASPGIDPQKILSLPSTALRLRTLRAAAAAWRARSPLYVVYLLAQHLGMRAGEIAAARWSWIEDHAGGARWMVIRDRPDDGFRVKGRPGRAPIRAAVWRRLQAYRSDSPLIVPGSTPTARHKLIYREAADWLEGVGWAEVETNKRIHELRRLYGSKVWTKYGKESCHEWMRHGSFATTERHYLHLCADWRRRELWGI